MGWTTIGPRAPRRSWLAIHIEGAPDAAAAAIEDVCVDHGGADVVVAEEFLDRADVVAALEEVGGEGVPQGVTARGLGDVGAADGLLDGPLQHRLVEVVPVVLPGRGVPEEACRRKDPLPAPFPRGAGVLTVQSAGEKHSPPASLEVAQVLPSDLLEVSRQGRFQRPG